MNKTYTTAHPQQCLHSAGQKRRMQGEGTVSMSDSVNEGYFPAIKSIERAEWKPIPQHLFNLWGEGSTPLKSSVFI